MINAPSGGAPEQAPRWDLTGTEGCGGGIRFLAPYLVVWGYVGIYRRTEYVGGERGAHEGGGRPPTSWLPGSFLDVGSKSSGSCSFRKSRSRRFHSIWTSFDILFVRNSEIGKKKQQFWVGPPVSRLVPKMI